MKVRPSSHIDNIPRKVINAPSSGQTLPMDLLDVFSPLKRKDGETDSGGERKEKRLKESTAKLEKSTREGSKRFSAVINVDGKKEKFVNNSTRRDDIRVKDREMDRETMKALTQKGYFLHTNETKKKLNPKQQSPLHLLGHLAKTTFLPKNQMSKVLVNRY
jgi:hypothetical protein